MNEIINALAVFISMTVWGVLHSWLAAFSTKDRVYRLCGEGLRRTYRLILVGVAVLTFLPILAMVILLPARVLWRITTPWLYLTLLIQGLALMGLVMTILQVDTLAFIGLR